MIVSGNPVTSELLAKVPGQKLFDRIVEGDLLAGAVAFAQERAAAGGAHPRVRDLKVRHDNAAAFIAFARTAVGALSKNYPAPLRCIDAIEAAINKRFDDGMAVEREGFLALMTTPESRALRHAFFAERAASKIPDVPESTPVREIRKVGVIGAGTMGGGIAMNFLNAGIPVTILETKAEALERGLATIRKNYEGAVQQGQPQRREARAAHGPAYADARLRRPRRRRPRHRGGVRGHGRQGGRVPRARRGGEARRDPGHATPRRSTSTGSPPSRSARRT